MSLNAPAFILANAYTKKEIEEGGGGGGVSEWKNLKNKPFDEVDTDDNLKIEADSDNKKHLKLDIPNKVDTFSANNENFDEIVSNAKDGDFIVNEDEEGGEGSSVKIDGKTITKNSKDEIQVAKSITDKLDNTADSVEEIENATPATDKLVSAVGLQNFSNMFARRLRIPLDAGKNMIGQWQNVDNSQFKSHDDSGKANFLFAPCLYFEDSDIPPFHDVDIEFGFDKSLDQTIVLGGYQFWSNPVDNNGNPIVDDEGRRCGGICIILANEETDNPIDVIVDIRWLNIEEEVVVWND